MDKATFFIIHYLAHPMQINNKQIDAKIIEISDVLKTHNENSISLMGGVGSSILYWGYMYKFYKKRDYLNICYKKIEEALGLLSKQPGYSSFAGGHIGLLWALCHLYKHNLVDVESNFFDAFDNVALEYAMQELSNKNYDYLHGALGAALYFFERLPNKSAEKALNKILDGLVTLAVDLPEGITWREYSLTAPEQDDSKSFYNLGTAHGVPGIISVLTMFSEAGIKKTISNKVLRKSIDWLLSKKNDPSKIAVFPYYIAPHEPDNDKESRLAWCYGDLGASYCIFKAGEATGNEKWKKEAIEIALKTTKRRDPLDNKQLDAAICHGTSGIAYIYFKYYMHTGIKEFKVASDFWQEQTLLLAKYKNGAAGYKRYDALNNKMKNDFGFLEGAAGIGLVLSSIRKKRHFDWDRSLLLS